MSSEPRAAVGAFAKVVSLALLALVVLAVPAEAHRHHHFFYAGGGSATEPDKDAALVVDGSSGKVLYARNADALRHPASLTKMMTLYLLFDALKDGRVTMTTQLPVSSHAAAQKPTNLHLSAGDTVPVELAIKAVVVRSANDVAVAIAEGLGGTESHFAEMMTAKAKEFGMHSTYYHNASGLPDPLQITTANDLAILARHLAYDYPQYFHFFSTPSFWFRGRTYPTHDNLIGRYDGADGIKTGYTGMSGFNLVSSVVRGGAHIVGVVMGGRTAHLRDRAMVALLDNAFTQIAQNPTLVARAQVPWQSTAVALNSSPIQINAAGTSSASPVSSPTTGTDSQTLAMLAAQASMPSDADDEDAAESKTNEGNLGLAPQTAIGQAPVRMQPLPTAPTIAQGPSTPAQATAPYRSAPVVAQTPTIAQARLPFRSAPALTIVAEIIKPRTKPGQFEEAPFQFRHPTAVVAAVTPSPKPAALLTPPPPTPQPKPVVVASVAPTPAAAASLAHIKAAPGRPTSPGNEIGEGDIGDERDAVADTGARSWVIQIGAFATQTLARAQLAAYAEKSMDVLGQASRVVAPIQSVDGHTVYRARFGPFAEREARQVCTRLTQRGQTCFAAVATR